MMRYHVQFSHQLQIKHIPTSLNLKCISNQSLYTSCNCFLLIMSVVLFDWWCTCSIVSASPLYCACFKQSFILSCTLWFMSSKLSLLKFSILLYTSHTSLHSSKLCLSSQTPQSVVSHCNHFNFHWLSVFVWDILIIQKSYDPFTNWITGRRVTNIWHSVVKLIYWKNSCTDS